MVKKQTWYIDYVLVVMMVFCGSMLAWLSVARYVGYNTAMFDLGIMAQSIWSGTQGKPLLYTNPWVGGAHSQINFHVELFYFLLSPLYALFPDPRTLLIFQSLLFVLAAVPVYRLAMRRLDSRFAARCFALIYLCYPTAQTSVLWDLHSDTLAMPLLLFALDALDQRAWRRYSLFIILALICKFYVSVAVAGIGVVLFLWGIDSATDQRTTEKRIGIITTLGAIAYGLGAFFVLRPLFAASALDGVAESTQWYLNEFFGHFGDIQKTIVGRLFNALIVFGPILLLLGRGWRWFLPGVPIALAILISTGPSASYDYRYHHYATVVPFIIMVSIDSAGRMAQAGQAARTAGTWRKGRSWQGDLVVTTAAVLLFNVFLVATPLNPLFWKDIPGKGLDPSAYGTTERDRIKDQFLATSRIPPDAPIATSTLFAPHQINREIVYNVKYPGSIGISQLPTFLTYVDYALADALFDFFMPISKTRYNGGIAYEQEAIAVLLRDPSFGLVAARDGLLLWERDASEAERMLQQVMVITATTVPSTTMFGDQISLIDVHLGQPTDQRHHRLRVTFEWLLVGDTPLVHDYVAVSVLDGVAHNRLVHLPTYTLYPTSAWQPGQRIRETFDVDTSAIPPGEYSWRVGWYVLDSPYSYLTDERSLLPGSQTLVIGKVRVAD